MIRECTIQFSAKEDINTKELSNKSMWYTADTVVSIVSIGLTISGFMIAAASFLLGIYLSGYKDLVTEQRLTYYMILIMSLVGTVLILSGINIALVLKSGLPPMIKDTLMVFVVSPYVPTTVIILILLKSIRGGL